MDLNIRPYKILLPEDKTSLTMNIYDLIPLCSLYLPTFPTTNNEHIRSDPLCAPSICLPFLLQMGSQPGSDGSACCGQTVAPVSVFCLPKFSAVSLFSWLSVLICLCFLQSSKFWQILLLTLAKRMK